MLVDLGERGFSLTGGRDCQASEGPKGASASEAREQGSQKTDSSCH